MIGNAPATTAETTLLVKDYGDALLACLEERGDWVRSEDIASGAGGIILFLIELYRKYREDRCLSLIERSVQGLLAYCRNHPTDNYSLYTGRAGVVYVLIEYHLIKENRTLLKEGIAMLQYANRQYLRSRYTADDLYSGRSGTLLVILYLYQLTGDASLMELLGQFAGKILSNGWLSAAGMSWKTEEEYDLRPDGGMAGGVSGIRYAMGILRRCCAGPPLDFVVREAKRYIDSCWVPAFQNWGSFRKPIADRETFQAIIASYKANDRSIFDPVSELGWAEGAAGIILGNFGDFGAATGELGGGEYDHIRSTMRRALANNSVSCSNLYKGLAGMGLLYLTVKEQWGEDELREITGNLSGELAQHSGRPDLTGGLLLGNVGVAYFLLKAAQDERSADHILTPCSAMPHLQAASDLRLKTDTVLRNLLSRYYSRTFALMEQIAPQTLLSYLSNTFISKEGNELEKFAAFIGGVVPSGISASANQRLQDVFQLEKRVCDFERAERRTPLQLYLDEWLQRQSAGEDLNKPDDWLSNQVYVVSDKLCVIKSRWNWRFSNDYRTVNDEQKANLTDAPGDFTYMYMNMADGQAQEIFIGTDTLLLFQAFMQPKSIGQAVKDIKRYIFSLSESALKSLLLVFTGYANTGDFKDQLDDMMKYEITQWIYKSILSPTSPNHSSR